MEKDNEIISNFKNDSKSVRLTFLERERIRRNIILSNYVLPTPYWSYKKLVAVITVLLLIITGSGISFVAAESLPGDLLYPVKVNVNEGVINAMTLSSDAKAKLAADRANERLTEAEQLTVRGQLNSQNQAIIREKLKEHTNAVKTNVSILASEKKPEEAVKVINDLKNSLTQHEATLEALSTTQPIASQGGKEHVDSIISTVIEAKSEIENTKMEIDDSLNASSTDSNTNATSTATSTININISATSSATTTKDENKTQLNTTNQTNLKLESVIKR